VTLAVSCDVIVGSETASIGYPEIDVGLIPAMHFVHLPRQIGRHKAFELLFTGDPMEAQEAADRGSSIASSRRMRSSRPPTSWRRRSTRNRRS